ncbi:MAG: SIMPL domain-containing protein [Chloroflexota bacterium]
MNWKNWLLPVSIALLLVAVVLVGCTSASPKVLGEIKGVNFSSQQEGIWVTGEGKVTVVPDVANLQLGIETQAASVAQAQDDAAAAMNKVMAALTEQGVARKDIRTQYFSIQKVTRWDDKNQQEVVIGYRVTNTVMAKIRDVSKAGLIIDAVAVAGGDLTRVNSISFSVDDPSNYYEEARQKAMDDAKTKATQLARLASVTLGKPTYISENLQSPPIIYPARGLELAAPAADTPISPGETDVTLNVQVVYAIVQ